MDWITWGMRIQFLEGGSFSFSKPARQALVPTHLPAHRVQWNLLRTKQCRYEADHSPLYCSVSLPYLPYRIHCSYILTLWQHCCKVPGSNVHTHCWYFLSACCNKCWLKSPVRKKVLLTQHFFKCKTAPIHTTATNYIMTITHNTLNPVPFMVSHNSESQT
jgi:hypothetical protein